MQVANTRAGSGKDVISGTFKAFRSPQRAVADTDVNLHDAVDVDGAITTRCDVDTDPVILPGQDGHILNPIVKVNAEGRGGTVTKMGIDALVPFAADRELFNSCQVQGSRSGTIRNRVPKRAYFESNKPVRSCWRTRSFSVRISSRELLSPNGLSTSR